MLRAIATSLILLLLLGLGCHWEIPSDASRLTLDAQLAGEAQADGASPTDSNWRRTAAGWQKTDAWFPQDPVPPPRLNPLTLAWLMLLLSLFFLVAGNSTTPDSIASRKS